MLSVSGVGLAAKDGAWAVVDRRVLPILVMGVASRTVSISLPPQTVPPRTPAIAINAHATMAAITGNLPLHSCFSRMLFAKFFTRNTSSQIGRRFNNILRRYSECGLDASAGDVVVVADLVVVLRLLAGARTSYCMYIRTVRYDTVQYGTSRQAQASQRNPKLKPTGDILT